MTGDRVVIAGAGPVGLTAALTLTKQGVPVTVLEAGATLAAESRASTFHPSSLEMLADLGMYEPLAEAGIRAPTFAYRDRRRGLIAELDLGVLADDTAYPFRIQCEQNKLTAMLLDRLQAEPTFGIHFKARVQTVAQTDSGVSLTTEDGSEYDGEWLIAADGAHSAVRRSIAAEFEGITYPESFLVISTSEPLEDMLPDLAVVNYVMDPEEWAVLLRTPSHWRVLLPVAEAEAGPAATEPQRVQQRLAGICDLGRPWDVLHTSIYRVHQRVATSFRHGRVLLAGDAAHVNNPLGGMGMNSGLHDAVLIATSLASLINGSGDDDDLTATAEERRRVAREIVGRNSHANWERLRAGDTDEREQIYSELRAVAADPVAARESLLSATLLSSIRPFSRPDSPSESTPLG